jgi:ankyrin repeat protein
LLLLLELKVSYRLLTKKILNITGYLPLGLALIEQNTVIANTLINGNANVNATVNSEGATLLIDAIKRSDGFSANFLLDHKCDVNLTSNDTGDMALHMICTYSKDSSSSETFREMLDVGKKIIGRQNLEVNKQNSKGYSPLHLAILSGHMEMITELLKHQDINLNILTNDGKCALLLALLSHQFEDFSVAKCLIDNGAETNNVDDNGDNILQFLIKSQREDVAIFMCDHVNLDYKNQDNLTALHLASKYGLVNLTRKILACGASPNLQTGFEEMKTALHFAIEANNAELVEAFVDFKAGSNEAPDFNLRCANGDSPLSLALSLKHNDLVPILIKGGSDVNARNGESTLLHQAILKESAETAIFLLEQGADPNALTGEQESPLELAIHCRLESVVDALCARSVSLASPNILWSALETEQENIASVLVKHGIDTDCWSLGADGLQQTLLHRAIDEQNEYAAIFLIQSGCDLDSPRHSPNDGGDTTPTTRESPLHMCCTHGLAKVVQTLIEHGANVNSLNHENKTPLHHAIQNQHESIIAILLRHPSIDMKIRDKLGNTPFATALTVRNHKAAEKILDRWPTCAEQIDSRGRNFLHLAIMREDLESVLFLLAIQVDVNSRVHDVNQVTPLMLASQSENEMLIRNLILAGARLNDRDSTQKTALHISAERGRLCAVQALLQNGCDFDAIEGEGNNALHIAMREGMLPIVRELLTESRINAEVMNMKGRNPLHELCRCGRDSLAASICELFLECMPNYPINQPDLLGNSPLLLCK